MNKYLSGGFVGGLFVPTTVDIVAGIGLGLTESKKAKDFGKGMMYAGIANIVATVAVVAVGVATGIWIITNVSSPQLGQPTIGKYRVS